MNWKIGFFIWLKGLGIFAIPCIIVFPIGVFVILIALLISWPAILIYSLSLQLAKKLKFSFAASVAFMMLIPSSVSVATAMWLLNEFADFEMEAGFGINEAYLIPMFFCILSICFSTGKIRDYVNPDSVTEEFATE